MGEIEGPREGTGQIVRLYAEVATVQLDEGEVEAVIREAAAGSGAALGALNHVGRWLGVGLAALVNILNPRLIVLGGRFARIHPYVIDAIEDELARRALPASRALIRIVPATMGFDASLLGAAELAFEPLLNDPASWLDRTIHAPGRGTACA